jgi:hypothetical protein
MRGSGCARVVIRRHRHLHLARNQCTTGSINARALDTYPGALSLNNDGDNHANTPGRIDQPPRTACARMREGRGAGFAIPLQCLPGMEWTAGERAQHDRGDAARGGCRRDDPGRDSGPGRNRSDDRDGRAHRQSVRRAAVTGRGLEDQCLKDVGPAAMSQCSAILKPGTNGLSWNHTERSFVAFRMPSLPLRPSPFRAA